MHIRLIALVIAVSALLALPARGKVLVYEGFHEGDYVGYANLGGSAVSGNYTIGVQTGSSTTSRWTCSGNSYDFVSVDSKYGLPLPDVMTGIGFSAVGLSIETNHDKTNDVIRSAYHRLIDDTLNVSSGKLYLRMIVRASNGLFGKLVSGSSFANENGSYAGFGFCKAASGNDYLLSTSGPSIFFAVTKDANGTPLLSLCIRDTGGTLHTYTLDPDITPSGTSVPYICYAEISVNAGANGAERIRAGSKKVADFNSVDTLDWKVLSESDTTVEVDFLTGSSYPDAMAITGPCGTAGGFLRADEIFVTTTLYELLNFGVEPSGTPAVGQDSFSTNWKLIAKSDVTASADLYISEDESFSSPRVVSLGTGLSAGVHTATATDLDSFKTYWWKIVATNGEGELVETPVASFRTFYGGDIYVSAGNAGAAAPYNTPETAASNIVDAVAIADNGTTVHVARGTYNLPLSVAPISVTRAVRIVGTGNTPEDVIVKRSSRASANPSGGRSTQDCSIFHLNNSGALIANLVMYYGSVHQPTSGTTAGSAWIGANGGTISNCVVRGGYATHAYGASPGILISGPGLVTHCVITNNTCTSGLEPDTWGNSDVASAVVMKGAGSRLENCLVLNNRGSTTGTKDKLSTIYAASSASIVNCTVISNLARNCAGIYANGSGVTVKNCVMAGNFDVGNTTTNSNWMGSGTFVACATDDEAAINANCYIGTVGTFFKDYANGDYTPTTGGPLVNKGVNYEGMAAIDLAGQRRLLGSRVDIGCYEGNIAGTYIHLR